MCPYNRSAVTAVTAVAILSACAGESDGWVVENVCVGGSSITIIDQGQLVKATPKEGGKAVIVSVLPVKPGSSEGMRLIGSDNVERQPVGIRWNPMGSSPGPFTPGVFDIKDTQANDRTGKAMQHDIAFFIPDGVNIQTLKLKMPPTGAGVSTEVRGSCVDGFQ